jgi:hypothetical protein
MELLIVEGVRELPLLGGRRVGSQSSFDDDGDAIRLPAESPNQFVARHHKSEAAVERSERSSTTALTESRARGEGVRKDPLGSPLWLRWPLAATQARQDRP